MKLIYIKWIDAVADAEWQQKDEYEKPHICETVGYVQKKTKEYYVVASTISGDHTNARITIPNKWILQIKNVKIDE